MAPRTRKSTNKRCTVEDTDSEFEDIPEIQSREVKSNAQTPVDEISDTKDVNWRYPM
jgi:hypothetical protein